MHSLCVHILVNLFCLVNYNISSSLLIVCCCCCCFILYLLLLVEFLNGHSFFFLLHSPVLEPDLNLSFGETQHVRQFNAAPAREVPVEFELLLQLERLVARVRLTSSPPLVGVWACTIANRKAGFNTLIYTIFIGRNVVGQ